jgi:MFS transporter, SET family, sugar efflux transporter
LSAFSIVTRNPTLRMIGAALFLVGVFNASTYPYQSLIAIEVIGLSKPHFALLLVLASLTAVSASVLSGVIGDQHGHRRLIALIATGSSLLGMALMLVFPSKLSLILCHGILVPIGSSIFGQLFALARLAYPSTEGRDGILGLVRSAMSLAFLAMLVFWTFAFSANIAVTSVYISGALAALGLVTLVALSWPRDGKTEWTDTRSGLNFKQAFHEIAAPHVLIRLLLLGAITSSGGLYMTVISLVFDQSAQRGAADVALYVGLVAGWEVPCLILLPLVARRINRSTLIALGVGLYCCHVIALPLLAASPLIWGMTLVAGVGGTTMLALPIAYYQDLLHGRPGTAGAMLALQKLVADVLVAFAFALGTSIGGYTTVAIIGVAIALAGALGLYLIDRKLA